jgi:hypothetical protein
MFTASVAPAADARSGSRAATTKACHVTQSKSLNSDRAGRITFVNNTSGPARILWVSYSGKLVLYGTLPAGAFTEQPTYATHPWIVLDSAWSCVGYIVAPARSVVYNIGPSRSG